MAIYIQDGKFLDYTPSGDVTAGSLVKLGNDFYGVALRDIAANQKGALCVGGVLEFVSDGIIAAGSVVYWDADGAHAQAGAVANGYIGRAASAAAGDKVLVFLNAPNIGAFTPIAPGTKPVATQVAIAALTAANPAAITSGAPSAMTATVADSDNTELIADVTAIHAEVVKLVADATAIRAEVVKAVTDLATLKTAVNAAKVDLAAVVTQLEAAAVLE